VEAEHYDRAAIESAQNSVDRIVSAAGLDRARHGIGGAGQVGGVDVLALVDTAQLRAEQRARIFGRDLVPPDGQVVAADETAAGVVHLKILGHRTLERGEVDRRRLLDLVLVLPLSQAEPREQTAGLGD
jgi:hypothetical protein